MLERFKPKAEDVVRIDSESLRASVAAISEKMGVPPETAADVSMRAVTIAILASGAVKSIKTSTLLTAEEAMGAMQRAGNVGYRPPA